MRCSLGSRKSELTLNMSRPMFATSRPEGVRQFREIAGRALEQESAMSLNVNDELAINGVTYRVTPRSSAVS